MELMKLSDKVDELLWQYTGGTAFFDQLDEYVRNERKLVLDLFEIHYNMTHHKKYQRVVTSGRFGLLADQFGHRVDVFFPGGLRKLDEHILVSPMYGVIEPGCEYILIDDSHFSGRTSFHVGKEIERCGSILIHNIVAYDGCYEKRPEVTSLYRYYDYHNSHGNKIQEEDKNE